MIHFNKEVLTTGLVILSERKRPPAVTTKHLINDTGLINYKVLQNIDNLYTNSVQIISCTKLQIIQIYIQ